jgi:hypothetical protein
MEEGCDGLCDFLVQIGCGGLVCVVNKPLAQDQLSGRGQKIVFLASTVISRLVKSVVGIDCQRNSEVFAALGLNAIFIAFADNAFVGEAGVGEAF